MDSYYNRRFGSFRGAFRKFKSSKRQNFNFWDSLTAGYKIDAQKAYPALLEKKLRDKGWNTQVVNAGVSGETTEQGLRRVEWNLKQGPFEIVMICLGANDGLRQMPLKNSEANLEQIIQKFKKAGSKVLILGMKLPTNYPAQYRKDFEAMYARLAKKTQTAFLNFLLEGVAAEIDLNLDDGIHPNEKGHQIIAERVFKALGPLLPKPR